MGLRWVGLVRLARYTGLAGRKVPRCEEAHAFDETLELTECRRAERKGHGTVKVRGPGVAGIAGHVGGRRD